MSGRDLSAEIAQAYGYDGLGILVVRGVPGVAERRAALLPLGARFAALPASARAKYEHAASYYAFGWSHGKEKLEGRPDLAKGSYYNNPIHDAPCDAARGRVFPLPPSSASRSRG